MRSRVDDADEQRLLESSRRAERDEERAGLDFLRRDLRRRMNRESTIGRLNARRGAR